VCGRLKSDYRYSNKIVYNNFVWPEADEEQKEKIQTLVNEIIKVREKYDDKSLAELYDKLAMPEDLREAHKRLDAAVERLYRKEKFTSDKERLEFLMKRYVEMTK